jgi:hypothetical protein
LAGDFHASGRFTSARRCQNALAFDLDHTSAAIAIRAIAMRIAMAQMRNGCSEALSDLPDGLARLRFDLMAIQ